MKRLLPDSLAGWALLIIIAALTVAGITTLLAITQSRTESTRLKGLFQLAERVNSVTRAVVNEPAAGRAMLAAALGDATLIIRVDQMPLAEETSEETLTELQGVLLRRLSRPGITEVRVSRHQAGVNPLRPDTPGADAGPFERALSDISLQYAVGDGYVVSTRLADGTWINFVNTIAPPSNLWSIETIVLTLGGILIVLAASSWALRQLTGPYNVLARAADRFGLDLNSPPLPERGPREVRSAVRAFNSMQGRLKRMVEDRDQLVAAVSHDLRTPVTRLRLRAEYVDDGEQKRRMLGDLDEIETMTRSVLAFARNTAEPEAREMLDLVSLVDSLCIDTPGARLQLAPGLPARIAYCGQPVALRRCIANLVDNAVKYGKQANVSLALSAEAVRIRIEDDGPGVPPKDMEKVFRPFVRLEPSRNRETGGTGLGLTIARAVARSHGGEVVLANRPAGGLMAEIILPLPAAVQGSAAAVAAEPGRRQRVPAWLGGAREGAATGAADGIGTAGSQGKAAAGG
jgi:signal transduction histidine kinase